MQLFENLGLVLNILLLVIGGLWLPLFLLFYFYRIFRRRDQYESINLEEIKYDRERKDRLLSNNEVDIERYLSKILEELPYRTSKEVSSVISDRIDHIIKNEFREQSAHLVTELEKNQKVEKENSSSNKQLIRELAHSLNTPLSQIEASAEVLNIAPGLNESNKTIRAIKSSVELCKSFILAYRQMILVTGYSGGWEPKSLKNVLQSACEVYSESANIKLKILVEMPDKISGYSNNYIVALLLPLLENAVESSVQESELSIKFLQNKEFNIIKLTNYTHDIPSGPEIFDTGFTTKKDHQGIGLSTVKSLLSSMDESSIEYSVANKNVTFEIRFKGAN